MRWFGFNRGTPRLRPIPWTGRNTWRKRLSETRGNITAFIETRDGRVFGLKFGQEEYLYSFEDKRGDPFDDDKISLNSHVRIEWAPFTDKKGKEKKYISVLELLDTGAPSAASAPTDTGYRTPDQMQRAKAMTAAVELVNGVAMKVGTVEDAVGKVISAYHEILDALNEEEVPPPGPEDIPFE